MKILKYILFLLFIFFAFSNYGLAIHGTYPGGTWLLMIGFLIGGILAHRKSKEK
jgi:hypothetical protein